MHYAVTGSGQLAWMLSLSAKKLGHQCSFIQSPEQLSHFDFVTHESEFLDFEKWESSLSKANTYPSVSLMKRLSDKWEQKVLFKQYSLPTAEAFLHSSSSFPDQVPCVAKWTRQGYDGYGNLVIKSNDLLTQKAWDDFYLKSSEKNARIYLESFVPFEHECALVVARDFKGKVLRYPLFVTEQSKSVCHWVWGPAHRKYPQLQKQVDDLWPRIEAFVEALNYVGVLAFEFFSTADSLLLNEVAPRVHNSGHVTLDAFNYSQFDLHLLAPLGFDDIQLKALSECYGMKNLLGSRIQNVFPSTKVEALSSAKSFYWYGKAQERPGRKMGHINFLFNHETFEHEKNEVEEEELKLWQNLRS